MKKSKTKDSKKLIRASINSEVQEAETKKKAIAANIGGESISKKKLVYSNKQNRMIWIDK